VLSAAVVAAARALGVPSQALRPLAGASDRTWDTGEHVMRLGDAVTLDLEAAACAAAAGVVATPEVVDRVDLEDVSAVLIRRLPGTPAGHLDGIGVGRARQRGGACGRLHALLAEIIAPADVPPVTPRPPAEAAPVGGARLLHLDLHPFNVLVDAGDEVSGVLDWANAAAGHPILDRARTSSILTLDPRAAARRADAGWCALVEGWTQAGELAGLPSHATAWACRFMLEDLANRYSPLELSAVSAALGHAEGRIRRDAH
jgi:aminoglycoside phosphotransferase (APT) family kinase protein